MTQLPKDHFVVPYFLNSGFVDQLFYLAGAPVEVIDVREVHAVAGTDAGAVTLMLRKCTGTQAPASGTALLASTLNMKATANTPQSGALTTTLNDRKLAPGDRLAVDFTGTLTALASVALSVVLRPIAAAVRNYASEAAPALYSAVEKAFGGSFTIAQARTAISTALGAVDPLWSAPQPTNWTDYIDACNRILDCIEVNTHNNDRMRFWRTARGYLNALIDRIALEEASYRGDFGIVMAAAQVTDLNVLEGAMGQCLADNRVLKFQ